MSGAFSFRLMKCDDGARLGEITTAHGVIRTPAFMPVGTAATVKALYPAQLEAAGTDIVLANTYHLMLRPGAERIARLGGLHRFMRWKGPIITDSGGPLAPAAGSTWPRVGFDNCNSSNTSFSCQ